MTTTTSAAIMADNNWRYILYCHKHMAREDREQELKRDQREKKREGRG